MLNHTNTLLEQGEDPNTPLDDKYGWTLLHKATHLNNTLEVQRLLRKGADPMRRTHMNRRTPFCLALDSGYGPILALFLITFSKKAQHESIFRALDGMTATTALSLKEALANSQPYATMSRILETLEAKTAVLLTLLFGTRQPIAPHEYHAIRSQFEQALPKIDNPTEKERVNLVRLITLLTGAATNIRATNQPTGASVANMPQEIWNLFLYFSYQDEIDSVFRKTHSQAEGVLVIGRLVQISSFLYSRPPRQMKPENHSNQHASEDTKVIAPKPF